MTMKLTVERITPKVAKGMLENNTMNRALRPRTIDQYARDMSNGKWADAGDPIRINCDGTLLDGQHRLEAIVKSGVTIKMAVARGVDKRAMLTMDTGSKRTFADNLRILGHRNVSHLAAAVRWGVIYDDPDRKPYKTTTSSHPEMMQWMIDNPKIADHVTAVCAMGSPMIIGLRTPLIMIRFYAEKSLPDFDMFIHKLRTGEDLSAKDPLLALRRFVENSRIGTKPRPEVTAAVTIKAWNAFMEGRDVAVLSHRAGGASPEPFPVIVTSA